MNAVFATYAYESMKTAILMSVTTLMGRGRFGRSRACHKHLLHADTGKMHSSLVVAAMMTKIKHDKDNSETMKASTQTSTASR